MTGYRRYWLLDIGLAAAIVAIALVFGIERGHADAPVTAGGWTDEACTGQGQNTALVVTAGSAYTAGNVVGGTLALQYGRLGSGVPGESGILASVTITSASTQTAEFDVTFIIQQPTTVFTDKTAPAIVAADKPFVRYPIKLTNNFSGLGTHTVYGQDQIARAVKLPPGGGKIWAIITTPGTPTFTATTDLQLCIGMLKD